MDIDIELELQIKHLRCQLVVSKLGESDHDAIVVERTIVNLEVANGVFVVSSVDLLRPHREFVGGAVPVDARKVVQDAKAIPPGVLSLEGLNSMKGLDEMRRQML